jgi:uncharacterized protein YkwD
MLEMVNKERSQAGLSAVCYNEKLDKAADMQSTWNALGRAAEGRSLDGDIAEGVKKGEDAAHIAHSGKNGSSLSDRAKEAGYEFALVSENVAWGQPDVIQVMTDWMKSPGHKANILDKGGIKHAGFAMVKDKSGTLHWTQVFGSSGDSCIDPPTT